MSLPNVEVLTDAGRRRFSEEEKLQLIAETNAPGMTVSQVARLHGISRDLLFRWRRELRERSAGGQGLVPVHVSEAQGAGGRAIGSLAPQPSISIELKSGERVRIEGAVSAEVVRELVKALKR